MPTGRIPLPGRSLTWGYHHDRDGGRQWGVGLERGFRWRAYLLAGRLTIWVGAW